MKKSEIILEAKNIIKDIFKALNNNDNKDHWKKAIKYINEKVDLYEKI